jgi:hypothetical protein
MAYSGVQMMCGDMKSSNVAVEWVKLLCRMLEVPGPNLSLRPNDRIAHFGYFFFDTVRCARYVVVSRKCGIILSEALKLLII